MSNHRAVTVTSCVPKQKKDGTVISGHSAKGPWTMYSVMATEANGMPIQDEIISFAPLPLGEVTVDVSVKDDPKFGRTLTFAPVNGTPAASGGSTPAGEGHEMLRQSLRLLADRVGALETAMRNMGGFASTLAQTDVPATVAPTPAPSNDEEIPF